MYGLEDSSNTTVNPAPALDLDFTVPIETPEAAQRREDYDASAFVRSLGELPESVERCSNGHPLSKSPYCLWCQPVSEEELRSECYNCTHCRADRQWLQETDDEFELAGYSCGEELWKCKKCNHCIAFARMSPGSARDRVHVYGRRVHKKCICDDLRTGRMFLC